MDTTKIKYDEDYIVAEYVKGKTQKQLADELGTYNTTIRRILLRKGIRVRPQSEVRRTLHCNPFNGSYDSDYYLGYIAADGCVHADSNRITLSSNNDPQMMYKFASFLGPVGVSKYHNTKYDVIEYSVRVRDKEVRDYLVSLGLTPVKSLTLEYTGAWNMEFLRGVFDGDGCIHKTKKGLLRFSIATGSEKFAVQLYNYLLSYNPKLNKHKNGYLVVINRQDSIKRLYAKLYQNGSLFLERKKRKFGLE